MSTQRSFGIRFLTIGLCLLLLDATLAASSQKDDAARSRPDSAAKKAEQKKVEFPEEDTDMLMEPNDFLPVTVVRSQERHFHPPPTHEFLPIVRPHVNAAPRIDHHFGQPDSHSQAAQNYYPPFFREAPPLGHSRPYFPIPDGPPIPKYAVPHPENPSIHQQQRAFDTAILGSGDFGVLRGGTFYPDDELPYHPDDNNGDFFYGDSNNNGHGRPSTEEFIQKYTYPEEQFANFRDFADINTPADSAFSQFVVVYAAKNSTKPSPKHPSPKNIYEQLQLLDREKALEQKQQKQQKRRTSKSKTKLSKTKLQKKQKKKSIPKDLDYEPLLALS